MPWKRPAEPARGKVWKKFTGKSKDGAKPNTYVIVDILDEDREKCLDFLQEHFIRDEPLCHYFDLTSDQQSIATIRENWSEDMNQNISLACYVEDELGNLGELVSVNICVVYCKEDDMDMDFSKVNGENWRKLLPILMSIGGCCDVFKHYNTDRYFSSDVLAVDPKHRGQNIGGQMFLAADLLCKALGITCSATAVTAFPSQALAAKYGYELIGELPYSKVLDPNVDFKSWNLPNSAKIMGRKWN